MSEPILHVYWISTVLVLPSASADRRSTVASFVAGMLGSPFVGGMYGLGNQTEKQRGTSLKMGPILVAIEAGHFQKTIGKDDHQKLICRVCKTDFPCLVIQEAKKEQPAYAALLARQQRTERDSTRLDNVRHYNPTNFSLG